MGRVSTRHMRFLLPLSLAVLLQSCVVVNDQCSPKNCGGCCNASGQCVDGNSTNSCGNGGNTCSVCPGTFICSLGTCQPGSSSGGGTGGGGFGGGFGGGTGGGFLGGGAGGGLGGGTGGGGALASGNIIFLWNFAGQSCAQTPSVQNVRITIPGQTLMNGGLFGCSNGGSDGIQLLNFAGGAYAYTLEALSSSNVVLYAKSGNLTVNGNVQINATLDAVNAPGSVAISWTFPPNTTSSTPNCSQAGVTDVVVTIDATPQTVPCAQGYGTTQTIFSNLSPGNHTISLAARDTNQFTYYDASTTFMITAGQQISRSFLMGWAVGGLPVKWSFSNGVSQLNCAQAGASTMNVNLRDSTGTLLYGTTGVDVPCSDNGVQGTNFPFLYGGAYEIFLQSYGTGSVLYRSNFTTPPSVTVVNGQFPVIDGSTLNVLLTP